MKTFRVQKIRSCVQCGDVLSLRCAGCVKHPERKPRVLEYYDWPEIIKTAECGCCIQIRCQLNGCTKTMWRNVKHNRESRAVSKHFFCSPRCAGSSVGLSRVNRKKVPCAYCGTPVMKKMYDLKSFKNAFCHRTCYALYRSKTNHEESLAKFRDEEERALLQCLGKCRGMITEHHTPKKGPAKCTACGAQRDSGVAIAAGDKRA